MTACMTAPVTDGTACPRPAAGTHNHLELRRKAEGCITARTQRTRLQVGRRGARFSPGGPPLIRLVLTFDEGKLAILVRNYCSGAP